MSMGKAGKNTHLEHLEDSILLDGADGAAAAFEFIDALVDTFSGTQVAGNDFLITTKWDGSPAVICGVNVDDPQQWFFVGTKSVFNKTDPKIIMTEEDLVRHHGHQAELANKLKACLMYFPELELHKNYKVIQGDLLFTDDGVDAVIDGKTYFTFTPNTITYAIPKGTPAYNHAKRAKVGVVFHTRYGGDSIANMSASFGVDVTKFKSTPNVFVISASVDTVGSKMFLTAVEAKTIQSLLAKSMVLTKTAKVMLNTFAEQIDAADALTLGPLVKIFYNKLIRDGKPIGNIPTFTKDFLAYFEETVLKAVEKVSQPKSKAAKLDKLYTGQKFVASHAAAFAASVQLYVNIQQMKLLFIKKLQASDPTRTFLRTPDGFRVTAPEGFVAIRHGTKAMKLVDRLEFSMANFTIPKNWVKGGTS